MNLRLIMSGSGKESFKQVQAPLLRRDIPHDSSSVSRQVALPTAEPGRATEPELSSYQGIQVAREAVKEREESGRSGLEAAATAAIIHSPPHIEEHKAD
jgi:hypothetical protein